MSGPLLYSTNPWFATDIADRYRGGRHFCWCSEYFDSKSALPGSAASLIAPSSNPKRIYYKLQEDVRGEDKNSDLLRSYRKKFKRLANTWHADGEITVPQRDEIMAKVAPG